MALNLVKKNSSSPFHLQRSMVDQGGEGGAYESGGYTGQSTYSDGGVAESIAGFGKVFGAALGSRTAADDNASDVKRSERLGKKQERLHDKKLMNSDNDNLDNRARLEKREERVGIRKKAVDARISTYNEIDKPTLKSDVGSKGTPVNVNTKLSGRPEVETENQFNIGGQLKTDYSSNANLKAPKKTGAIMPQENYVLGKGPLLGNVKKLFPPIGATF